MALTRTRTRTQTALTKLAQLVAEAHHELALLEKLLAEHPKHYEYLEARYAEVQENRDALYATLRQFDADIDPTSIGESNAWLKQYGLRGSKAAVTRYLGSLAEQTQSSR